MRSVRDFARSSIHIATTAKPFRPGSIPVASAAIFFMLAIGVVFEIFTYRVEAFFFASQARKFSYRVTKGPSDSIRFPQAGPLNRQRGYSSLPVFVESLGKHGYAIEKQSRWSSDLIDLAAKGLNPPYREKNHSGLRIVGTRGESLYVAQYPRRGYASFDEIPELISGTLLFIEDRNLLDTLNPYRNPAVDWPRFFNVAGKLAVSVFVPGGNLAGGSTLATQLEKFRYSQDGITQGPGEKLRQMVSASLRAYRNGNRTVAARKAILFEYLNSVPLSAFPGTGEVHGLADGLETWYGSSFDSVNHYLSRLSVDPLAGSDSLFLQRAGTYYRMVVSLLVAFRRASYYLLEDPAALDEKTVTFLRLVRERNIAPAALCDAALRSNIDIRNSRTDAIFEGGFVPHKATDAVRASLLELLGVAGLYDLNRLDLTVRSTFDAAAQSGVAGFFAGLHVPGVLDSLYLRGERMLVSGNPDSVVYGLTLYEHVDGRNLLRVQTDSYNNPLSYNDGTKMDLGSTAKLRTLVCYLQIIEELHRSYSSMPGHELRALRIARADHLRAWVREYVLGRPGAAAADIIADALDREYSAGTGEAFYTGGGLHRFANFDRNHGGGYYSVQEAFRHSINLVFIRMMRDIVNFYMYKNPQIEDLLSDSADQQQRHEYLRRFAVYEGRIYLRRFFRQLKPLDGASVLDSLALEARPGKTAMAVLYLSVDPWPTAEGLQEFLVKHGYPEIDPDEARSLHGKLGPDSMSLADRGYLAGIHPLKLWTASYLRTRPHADARQVTMAAMPQIMEVYAWLFKTRHPWSQVKRIRTILEMEAFTSIHEQWRKAGYPFEYLVPSLATAIGASADRPAALAHLAGIIQNKGVHYPPRRVESLCFAQGTPYETVFGSRSRGGERVMSVEIASAVKECLIGVVDRGTAVRARNAFTLADGMVVAVGGKTGTGDHRRKVYDARGRFLYEEVRSRSAVFVFLIGDRFFGTLTVIVPGTQAGSYGFTSSYAVQIFKYLVPVLRPVVEGRREHEPRRTAPPHTTAGIFAPIWLASNTTD